MENFFLPLKDLEKAGKMENLVMLILKEVLVAIRHLKK